MKKIRNFFKEQQFISGVLASLVATLLVTVPSIISTISNIPKKLTQLEENVYILTQNVDLLTQSLNEFENISQNSIKNLNDNLLDVDISISDIYTQINGLEQKINDLSSKFVVLENNTTANVEDLEKRIEIVSDKLFTIAMQLSPVNTVTTSINELCESVINEDFTSNILWEYNDVIGIDPITHTEYTASQLAGQKLLLSYVEANQEILFYGQFNSNNQWDGECIINVYENNILSLITEAEYDDGKILNYKQVFSFWSNNNTKVWSIANRSNNGEFNTGETYNYYYDNDYVKNFDLDKASSINIVNVSEFESSITTQLESYYNGNTSNGYYNDTTGNAFLVTYENDGTTRMIYNGNFLQGNPIDNTGNAWYIVLGYDNANYYYYKGVVHNGKRPDNTDDNLTKISTNEIEEMVKDLDLNCTFNWKVVE